MPSPITSIAPLTTSLRDITIKPNIDGFLSPIHTQSDTVSFSGNNTPRRRFPKRSGWAIPPFVSALPTPSIPQVALPSDLTLPTESLRDVFYRYRSHCTSTAQAMALANRLNSKHFCVSAPDHESVYDLAMLDTHPVVMEQKGRIILDMLDHAEAVMSQAEGKAAKTDAGIERIDRLESFLLERLATTGHMPYLKEYNARYHNATVVSLQPRMQDMGEGRRVYTFNAYHEILSLKSPVKKPFRTFTEPVMKPLKADQAANTAPQPLHVIVRDPDSYAIKPHETVEGLQTVAAYINRRLTHPVVRKSVREAFDRLGDNRTDVETFTRDVKEVMAIINDTLNIRPDIHVEPLPPAKTVGKRERLGIRLAPAYYDDRLNTVGFIPAALWEIFDQLDDQHKGNPTLAKYKRSEYVLKAMVEEAQHAWQQCLVKAFINEDYDRLMGLARFSETMIIRLGDYVGNVACYNQPDKFQMIGLDIDHWYKNQPIERDAKTVVDFVIDGVADTILPPKA